MLGLGLLVAITSCGGDSEPVEATTGVPLDDAVGADEGDRGADVVPDAPDGSGGSSGDLAPASCDTAHPPWGLGGGDMLPGTDCRDCHRPRGRAKTAFSVAGTVFAERHCAAQGVAGVAIRIVDARGTEVVLESNAVGNFYTDARLESPLRVALVRGDVEVAMFDSVMNGSCSRCHAADARIGLLTAP